MEPMVEPSDEFQFRLEPWPAARPQDVENPGYDVKRFNLAHFLNAERMLRHARELDMAVSLIFHLDGADKGVDPFGKEGAGGEDERRYYRYAVARFAAFSNVTWDVTNEWHLFRDEAWTNAMGAFIKECDPYDHLTTVHGKDTFPFRSASWCDFASVQSWDEHGGYDFMRKNRIGQTEAGRPMPQINEEYGYEDHYPYPWGEKRRWPLRIAETRRKLAWEITMAGAYQTTGERANVANMGGWLTGRGNDSMTMLAGYARLREFFEKLPWWRLDPYPQLADASSLCLAEPGQRYVLYLREGGRASVDLAAGKYRVRRFNPRSGEWQDLAEALGSERWTSPLMPDTEDWALLIERR
jgi:hypothetical protein